jgi:hypothetical protein
MRGILRRRKCLFAPKRNLQGRGKLPEYLLDFFKKTLRQGSGFFLPKRCELF